MSKMHDTSLDVKKEHFEKFVELLRNQFWHGGEKYALSDTREFTDALCECFPGESGTDWILGTCMKYLGRFKNFQREKDLLKVATYMYLTWLKHGFHLRADDSHDEDTKREG